MGKKSKFLIFITSVLSVSAYSAFFSYAFAAKIPVEFLSKPPAVDTYNSSMELTDPLNFEIKNNTPVALPIKIGDSLGFSRKDMGANDCSHLTKLASGKTCLFGFNFDTPFPVSPLKDTFTINYDGRLSLIDEVSFKQTGPQELVVDTEYSDNFNTAFEAPAGRVSRVQDTSDIFSSSGDVVVKNISDKHLTGITAEPSSSDIQITENGCALGVGAGETCNVRYRYRPVRIKKNLHLSNSTSGVYGENEYIKIRLNGLEQDSAPIQTIAFEPGRFISLPYSLSSYKYFPALQVEDVYVDPDTGYISSATAVGLAEYTGEKVVLVKNKADAGDSDLAWRTYTTANGLGFHYVKSVYTKGDKMAAATKNGVAVSLDKGANWKNYTIADGLGANDVDKVFIDGHGTFYAATTLGLAMSSNGMTWINHSNLPNNDVQAVFVSGNKIYAGTTTGLTISDDGGATWSALKVSGQQVEDIFADGQNIYLATNHGVYYSTNSGDSWSNSTDSDGLGSNLVQGIYAVGHTIYAATRPPFEIGLENGYHGGVSISSNGGATWTNYTMDDGLPSNTINDVFVDKDGNIWAATLGGLVKGVVSSAPKKGYGPSAPITWIVYRYNNGTIGDGQHGLGEAPVQSIYTLGDTVLAGTSYSNGLFVSENDGKSFLDKTNLPGDPIDINDIHESNSKIYVATDNGLSVSDDECTTWGIPYLPPKLGSTIVKGVFVKDDYIFAATVPMTPVNNLLGAGNLGGLSVSLDGGNDWDTYTQIYGLGSNSVSDIDMDSSGDNIFVATLWGLSVAHTGGFHSWYNYTTSDGLGSNMVLGVDEEPDPVNALKEIIFAATKGGLSIGTENDDLTKYGQKTWSWINKTITSGLGSNNVYDVESKADEIGTKEDVYAATSGGLSIGVYDPLDPSTLEFSNKTIEDGLNSNIIYDVESKDNSSVGYREIFVGDTGGLNKTVILRSTTKK